MKSKLPPTLLDIASKERQDKIEATFLKEWTEPQFRAIRRAISKHFSMSEMKTSHGDYPAMYLGYEAINERLGLAYTSSSSYAGYWVCNTEVYDFRYPGFHYVGFTIGEGFYAILKNEKEEEIIINI